MEHIFRLWEEYDMEVDREKKIACKRAFHEAIEAFLRSEKLPYDRWVFLHEASEHYRTWRRRHRS